MQRVCVRVWVLSCKCYLSGTRYYWNDTDIKTRVDFVTSWANTWSVTPVQRPLTSEYFTHLQTPEHTLTVTHGTVQDQHTNAFILQRISDRTVRLLTSSLSSVLNDWHLFFNCIFLILLFFMFRPSRPFRQVLSCHRETDGWTLKHFLIFTIVLAVYWWSEKVITNKYKLVF